MKLTRFSVEQTAAVSRQHTAGLSVAELARKLELSEQTLHRWKEKYAGL
jgi:putative transposase